MQLLEAGELDVVFGRASWLGQRPTPRIKHRVVRYEALALLLPREHALARMPAIPVRDLAGLELDTNAASPEAHDWNDLMAQLLELTGARPTPPHLPAVGLQDQALHLVQQGLPIVTTVDHVPVPGGVLRRIVEPVPMYVWSMLSRAGDRSSGVRALAEAAEGAARAWEWLDLPAAAWLPEPEAGGAPGTR